MSFPMLARVSGLGGQPWDDLTNVCQCLTMAGVESMMVPSMSNRNPEKEACSAGNE